MVSRTVGRVALAVALAVIFCLGAYAATSMIRYTYDDLNRLIKVEYPGNVVEYGYDGTGNRIVLSITEADPLAAGFSYSPSLLTVQFTDASTGSILGWSWGFGDGTTGLPAHTSGLPCPQHLSNQLGYLLHGKRLHD